MHSDEGRRPSSEDFFRIIENASQAAAYGSVSSFNPCVSEENSDDDDGIPGSKTDFSDSICGWCDRPISSEEITIRFLDCSWRLHKCPLVARSGYLKRLLADCAEAELPSNFPGGEEAFEWAVSFCYESTILIKPSNVAALRCAAEVLEMTEEHGIGNLKQRCDMYLLHVVLQSWVDTILVLQKCEQLLPLAEDLLIVNRCIHTLTMMICGDVGDPASQDLIQTLGTPSRSKQLHSWHTMISRAEKQPSAEWWINDLPQLPLFFFSRIVKLIRKNGMEEKLLGEVVIKYAQKWLFSAKIEESSSLAATYGFIFQGILELLPIGKCMVPVRFLFTLLKFSFNLQVDKECRADIEARIALQLETATLDDYLIPLEVCGKSCKVVYVLDSMKTIVSSFMAQHRVLNSRSSDYLHNIGGINLDGTLDDVPTVARAWDEYLAQVASELDISSSKFSDLIDVIPPFVRSNHDQLYKSVHIYLKSHAEISQQERLIVCRSLNCQKLSQDLCIHAVQNDMMPLRLVVQAMFMQQLQTRNAITSHLITGSPSSQHSMADPLKLPLNMMSPLDSRAEALRNHLNLRSPARANACFTPVNTNYYDSPEEKVDYLVADLEDTNQRLQTVEAALVHMRRTLQEVMPIEFDSPKDSKKKHKNNPVSRIFHRIRSKYFCKSSSKAPHLAPNLASPHPGSIESENWSEIESDSMLSWEDCACPRSEGRRRSISCHHRHHSVA